MTSESTPEPPEEDNDSSLLGSMPWAPENATRMQRINLAAHQHFAMIGRVAANWSYLEARVDTESIELAGLDGMTGVCFTAQVAGIARKLDAYIALARLKGASKVSLCKLDQFYKAAQRLSEARNRIVHDVWIFDDPESPVRFEATARKAVKLEPVPVSLDKVLNLANGIDALIWEFIALANAVAVEIRQPSPEMP